MIRASAKIDARTTEVMMRRSITPWAAIACLILLSAGTAHAQSRVARPRWGPGYTPQLSPYLNLLRGGDPAANYYLGVIPEIQRRQVQNQFGAEILNLEEEQKREASMLATQDKDLLERRLTTGHGVTSNSTLNLFNNTQGFYPQVQVPGARQQPTTFQQRRRR